MDVLILGGTNFLGRHIVERALQRQHRLTLFNRGQTNPQLFPEVEKLRGNRDGNLAALAGRSFDAVVDTSGFVPRVVAETIDALGDIGHYTFVSTMSVYTDDARASGRASEDAPVAPLEEPTEEVTHESYGPLKALCEDVVRAGSESAFIPRPGLIVGPWDPTGRFTYWPLRIADGGRMLAPKPPEAPVQMIDARDLAAWIVDAAQRRLAGTYNAISPPTTMADVLETCRCVAGSDAEFVWIDGDFLEQQGIGPWMELPLWIGPEQDDAMRSPVERALANGLTIRPLEDTARDTLNWAQSGQAPGDPPAGLAREKEQRVLEAWLAAA
jgi:2'-hydroxyisoflavone reductase